MTEPAADDWDFELHAMYRIYDGFGRPLYFGESGNVFKRLAQHEEKAWFRRPEITIKISYLPNRAEALVAESRAIAAEKPWYNKAGVTPSPGSAAQQAAEEKRQRAAEEKLRTAEEERNAAEERQRLAEEEERRIREQPSRDLLADIDQVLGTERVRLSVLPGLLRQLVPGHAAYQSLTGVQLRAELTRLGVRTTKAGNVPLLDPQDFRKARGPLNRVNS